MDENRITYFAETDARNKRLKFGIKAKDRTRHVYVIGKTGMGKSTLLENMAVQDIQNGEGMAFIDPHGKTADLLLEYVPKERIRDVIYIAPFDTDHPISFNVLESVDPQKRHLVVSGLMSTFKKIWEDAWSARMEYILTNTLLALLEAPGSTLLGVNRMLSDKAYRNQIISYIKDPSVKTFWTKEFANYTERMAAEAVPAIQNKVGQFTANPLIRNMIGQAESSFDIRKAMDERKIMIINLSKGKIGDENMKLLGGLLVTKIYLAAMSRADVPDRVMKMLPNFYVFVDEFQNFANASFADILSEARKYKLNLTIAHQYIEQMEENVSAAVFGNVGTMIAFRVGATDAEVLEKEFSPEFTLEDLVNLGFAQIYLKLMIDGLSSSPFSAVTLGPIAHPDTTYVTDIIAASREQFALPRAEVEEMIAKFHEATPAPGKVAAKPLASSTPIKSASVSSPVAPQTQSTSPVAASVSNPTSASTPKSPIDAVPTIKMPEVIPAQKKPERIPTPTPVSKPVVNSTPPTSSAPTKNSPQTASSLSAALRSSLSTSPVKAPPATPAIKASQPIVSAAPKPPVIETRPIAAPIITAKPVSLSTLSPRPLKKTDPKVPSAQNVADLKNALAAVLGKGKPQVRAESSKELGDAERKTTHAIQDEKYHEAPPKKRAKPKMAQAPKLAKNAGAHKAHAEVINAAHSSESVDLQEVPEEVLKQVLKME